MFEYDAFNRLVNVAENLHGHKGALLAHHRYRVDGRRAERCANVLSGDPDVDDGFADCRISLYKGTLTNMPALIKGWVREAYKDLPARIQGFVETYLPGFIRGTEYRNLGARLVFIQPVSLPARIHGWAEAYLQGIITGEDYPWNLPASIYGTGSFKNLPASIRSLAEAGIFRNLPASLNVLLGTRDLPVELYVYQHKNLNAYLNSGTERKDLGAEIYPKMIRLTAVLSIMTMEHKDLIGVINAACLKSDYRTLSAVITPAMIGLTELPFRLLPLHMKLKAGLEGAAGILNRLTDQTVHLGSPRTHLPAPPGRLPAVLGEASRSAGVPPGRRIPSGRAGLDERREELPG